MSGSLAALVSVSLASLCVETLLYGCFLILFALSLYLIINTPSIRGERRIYPKPMVCFSILIFFLVTACWILSVVQAFQAFASGRPAAEVFADRSQLSSVLREGVLMGLFMTSNLTIIYRLWLVWNRSRRVIILPIILLFVLGAFAVMRVSELAGKNIVQNEQIVIFGIGMSSLSIDVYSAGMIIYKLCQAGMITRDCENISWFKFIMVALVESLSLYTIWGLLFAILFSFKLPVSGVFGDTQSTVIGIAFAILHVRVGARRLGRDAATLVEGRSSRAKAYGEA